jgi:hypothetical protein
VTGEVDERVTQDLGCPAEALGDDQRLPGANGVLCAVDLDHPFTGDADQHDVDFAVDVPAYPIASSEDEQVEIEVFALPRPDRSGRGCRSGLSDEIDDACDARW